MERPEPLIVASNRGPVGFRQGPDGALEEVRGSGGLVTALRPLVDRMAKAVDKGMRIDGVELVSKTKEPV